MRVICWDMIELITNLEAVLDDLIHLRSLDDGTLDNVKLDHHINTLEETIKKLSCSLV